MIRYTQDYSTSTCDAVARLGTGLPHFVDSEMKPYTVINRYIADHFRRWSKNTTRTVAENLGDFLVWLESANLSLEQIKVRHVEIYMNALASPAVPKPLSLSTVVQRVGHACRFFDWAKSKKDVFSLWDGVADSEQLLTRTTRGLYSKRASSDITPRLIRQNTKFLYLPDAIRFVGGFKNASGEDHQGQVVRNQLMAKVMLQCGLRVEETVSLPVDWVNEIVVDEKRAMQLGRVKGKGRKLRAIEWPTRLLLEVQEYIDFLRQRIVERAKESVPPYSESEAVFLGENGEAISTNWMSKLFRRNSKITGIRCTPHMLRHTYGTYHITDCSFFIIGFQQIPIV